MRSVNRQYLHSVDHIRAFAAILIVIYHGLFALAPTMLDQPPFSPSWRPETRSPLLAVVYEGHTAVTLFMVLSGFILTLGVLGREVSFGRFMANRALRIYPLFVVLLMIGMAGNWSSFTLGGLFRQLLALGNMPGNDFLGPAGAMFWAVGVELQFYLVLPLLLGMVARSGIRAIWRLLLAIVVVRTLLWATVPGHDVYSMLYLNIAGRIDQFLLGIIGAWLYVHRRERFRGRARLAVALSAAILALWAFHLSGGSHSDSAWRLVWVDLEGLLWMVVVLAYVATAHGQGRVSRAVAKIGELSYSVYLLHIVVLYVVIEHRLWLDLPLLPTVADTFVTTLLVVLPLTISVSLVTYHGIELPFLRMRVRYVKGAEGDPIAVPTARRTTGPSPERDPVAHRPQARRASDDGRPGRRAGR